MKITIANGEIVDLSDLPKEEIIQHYAALNARYKIACQEADAQKYKQASVMREKDEMRDSVINLIERLTSDYSRDDFAGLLLDLALGNE